MTRRSVKPDFARRVDVACPHNGHFARSHSGEPLEFDHGPDRAGDVRPDRLDRLHRHRHDGGRFLGVGPALLKAPYGGQGAVDAFSDQLLRGGPLEDADDPSNPLLDRGAAEP